MRGSGFRGTSDPRTRPAQELRRPRGRARHRLRGRARRGVRPARPQRRRQDDDRRDPRGLPRAHVGRSSACSGMDPGERDAACASASASCCRAAACTATSPSARPSRTGRALPAPARRRRGASHSSGSSEKADARARTLSGGQLRRLDLALALIGDPELIFLDEPTTGFDPAGAPRRVGERSRSLQDLGKTVLLTTHYLDEAQTLCDRVAIVKDGRIVAEGPPSELGATPRPATASAGPTSRAAHRTERGDRPDGAPAQAHRRRDDARQPVQRPVRHAADARGRVPGADREGVTDSERHRGGGATMSNTALAWRQFRLERKMFWRNPTPPSSASRCR